LIEFKSYFRILLHILNKYHFGRLFIFM